MKEESSVIHFQGQKLGSCDSGLLQREAQSSRLVGRDGVPAFVALVGTGVWPSISHSSELCVLSVKTVRPSSGVDRERFPGTWPRKPRWEPFVDSLLSWWVCGAQARGGGRHLAVCAVQTAQPAESLGTLLLPTDPDCLGWGTVIRLLAFAHHFFQTPACSRNSHYSAHSTHGGSLEGMCTRVSIPMKSHRDVQPLCVYPTLVYM